MDDFHHTATIHRRPPAGSWGTVATGVRCRGQPTAEPGVAQSDPGRTVDARYWFQFPTGTDLRAGDGVTLTASWLASMVSKRFLAEPPRDWGFGGGMQVTLVETEDDFT